MFVNDFVSEIFPAFKSLKLKASINSPSLCLHVKRVMTALENAVFSLNDAKVFIEYLMNLGERQKAWPERLENFDVSILLCRSRLLRGKYCCIELYSDVNCSSEKYNAI